jgi:hypothetical protein
MGVETPIPPILMYAAAPDGAPPRRINYRKNLGILDNTVICPAVPREASNPKGMR